MSKYVHPSQLHDYIPVELGINPDGTTDFKGATHHTRVPSKDEKFSYEKEGWEDVIYLVPKIVKYNSDHINKEGGYVYILTNVVYPGICKIGFTTSQVEKRLQQINNAGSLVDWEVAYSYWCVKPYFLEQSVHKALEHKRKRGDREFFEISVDEATNVIETMGKNYT